MQSEDRAFICRLLDIYGGTLSERHRDLADLYYNEDLSLAEISENCGLTRQGVRDAVKRAVADLYELEKVLGFASKSENIVKFAESIKQSDDKDDIVRLADRIIGEI